MKGFEFHAVFEHGAKRGIVLTYPDVPEAITQGADERQPEDVPERHERALGGVRLGPLMQSSTACPTVGPKPRWLGHTGPPALPWPHEHHANGVAGMIGHA